VNADPAVPQTISDDDWYRIQVGVAKAIPVIDGPWVDPAGLKLKRLWTLTRALRENQ
jgi:hypothetical protein